MELQESEECNTAKMAYEMDMQIIRFESDTPDLENHIRSDARTVKGFQSDCTVVDIKGWSGTIKVSGRVAGLGIVEARCCEVK